MQKSTMKQVQGSNLQLLFVKKFKAENFRKALSEKSIMKQKRLNSEAFCHQLYKEVSFRRSQRIEQNSRSAFSKKPIPFIELLMEKFTKKQLQDADFSFCYLCSREQNVKFSVLKQLGITEDHLFKEALHLSRSSKS